MRVYKEEGQQIIAPTPPGVSLRLNDLTYDSYDFVLAGQDTVCSKNPRNQIIKYIDISGRMSQSILRNGMTSPVFATMKRSSTARSILKRPNSLAMSPSPFPYANFSVMISPSLKSPHVQFLASPELVETYAAHSPETYDRAPIKVSPNPLAMPARHARYFSPTMENFKLAPPPKPKAAAMKRLNSIYQAAQCASPAITEFEDPRSPKPHAAPIQQIRFASFSPLTRPTRDLGKSISSYPRSPYPSAPLSPSWPQETESTEGRGRRMSDSSVANGPARSQSVGTASRQSTVSRGPVPFTPIPSPLQQSFKSPRPLHRSHKPAPLDLEPQDTSVLSNEFWESMTLEGETPMVTALEYPESAVDMEEIDLKSPAPGLKSPAPALVFGVRDGSVWSPSVPKKPAAREALLRTALKSPGLAIYNTKRSVIASPSPKDPFASFPSFSAALSMGMSAPTIAYPARAALERD